MHYEIHVKYYDFNDDLQQYYQFSCDQNRNEDCFSNFPWHSSVEFLSHEKVYEDKIFEIFGMENLGNELILIGSFLHMQEDHVEELVSLHYFESQNEPSTNIFESDFEIENIEQPTVIYESSLTVLFIKNKCLFIFFNICLPAYLNHQWSQMFYCL